MPVRPSMGRMHDDAYKPACSRLHYQSIYAGIFRYFSHNHRRGSRVREVVRIRYAWTLQCRLAPLCDGAGAAWHRSVSRPGHQGTVAHQSPTLVFGGAEDSMAGREGVSGPHEVYLQTPSLNGRPAASDAGLGHVPHFEAPEKRPIRRNRLPKRVGAARSIHRLGHLLHGRNRSSAG